MVGAAPYNLTVDLAPPTYVGIVGREVELGNSSINAIIGTVSDGETPLGNINVRVETAPTGIYVTNIVNTNGTISAESQPVAPRNPARIWSH